ncbi:hypothetical protein AIOL_002098 [Candidatus Rhodobacter oscarellae]|uniref:Uncharacterized protein n=1 Tax=Candidatus Rhodobacter oscarellae TaxID=1675527 RepID=A0A0J9GUA0_9RHOB|nr:hypothetical protein [Candidatus Rhodobacter lobularis]KMW57138.1 hypothetical protein AIOL_002098 [Candidatus Rhodobacter lobularis]
MSRPPQPPVYLERRSYRRRRLIDAIRLLPFLGFILFLLPLLAINGSDATGGSTAWGGLYLFAAWAGLIALSAGLVRWLSHFDDDEPEEGPPQ